MMPNGTVENQKIREALPTNYGENFLTDNVCQIELVYFKITRG